MNTIILWDISFTQKYLTLLYMNNEKTEGEIKETILFTTAEKIIAHLEINLHKEKERLICIHRKL